MIGFGNVYECGIFPGGLKMTTFVKREPVYEEEETNMRCITIKNEPDTSVVLGDEVTEHEHKVISSYCSLAIGGTFETGDPLINQTSTRVKDEIAMKDKSIQDETFDKFSNNSNGKRSLCVDDSIRYAGSSWSMDMDVGQVNITKTDTEQHQGEIKTESDHGTEYCEYQQPMITDVRTVLPGENNGSELITKQGKAFSSWEDDNDTDYDPAKHVSDSFYNEESDIDITPDLTRFTTEEASTSSNPRSAFVIQSEQPEVQVLQSKDKELGKRQYDKKHFCLYCEQPQNKLPRHLQLHHKNEIEVTKILSLPKNSKKRKVLLFRILNKGNYNHNYEVIKRKKGTIIPLRRPTSNIPYTEYAPCEHCYGFVLKRDLWRHVQSCPLQNTEAADAGKCVVANGKLLQITRGKEANGQLKGVLATMDDSDGCEDASDASEGKLQFLFLYE